MRKFSLGLALWSVLTTSCGADPDGVAGLPPSGQLGGGQPAGGQPGGPGGLTDAGQIISPVVPQQDASVIVYADAGDPNGCVATKAAAPPASNPKIDIVWIVDSSQSMFDEQQRIKNNLTQFADAITSANIDVSIVMVSQTPGLIPGSIQVPGLCPELDPDPLAGTPLATDPRYHFVRMDVTSQMPLEAALSTYPQYSAFLRPGSTVHYIVVTDDDARFKNLPSADGRATQFQADMSAQLGRPFTLHTISSPGPTACSSSVCEPDLNAGICFFLMLNCGASAPGSTYYALAQQTQGLTASICEADWTGIFRMFQEAVIQSAPLPCDYNIPPPPTGETIDPLRVNVGYTPAGAQAEEVFPKVPNAAACADSRAWHYDNDTTPSKVLLCPSACTHVAQGGSMNIAFGCQTVILR